MSKNYSRTGWVLKCDIRKFFASIDHEVLLEILSRYIPDLEIMFLLEEIIDSFSVSPGVGVPLGNLTSQLFCNVYMNELDQFMKHSLHAKHYVRYADDFAILHEDTEWLEAKLPLISSFLKERLKLDLHPNKVFISTVASGVDFLGWVNFPTHQVIRSTTKKRILRRITDHPTNDTLQSYIGHLKDGNAYKLQQKVLSYRNGS